mgnify:CR=1 FL=1
MVASSKKRSRVQTKRDLERLVFGKCDADSSDEDLDSQLVNDNGRHTAEEKAATEEKTAAAWNDSDDEDLEVNVVDGKARLRKLRKAEEEVVLGGKQYEERLREQFTKQHGAVPDWANAAASSDKEEEDAGQNSDSDSDADSDDNDEDILASASLGILYQDTQIYTDP